MTEPMSSMLTRALAARDSMLDEAHEAALRLFNGFTEGNPQLAIDLYGQTVIFHNYANPSGAGEALVRESMEIVLARFPWIRSGMVKARAASTTEERRGKVLFGTEFTEQVREYGVCYAINLLMNRDASLYLDTRNVRAWALRELRGKTVLNTFAYTGSLGVAALAGGAARVVQLDRNGQFLALAKQSYSLNGFPVRAEDFLVGDFFSKISYLKKSGARFDCVFLDPPFFSTGAGGTVDLNHESSRLINKVRPLIHDGGYLVAINNALFVSGQQYLDSLHELCADGYLSINALIDVPVDFTGFFETRQGTPVSDPHPFNHSTKIAVLAVTRKG